MNELSGTIDF